MTGTAPCILSGYNADASSIPDMLATPIELVKHTIGAGVENILNFSFDFVPTNPAAVCSFFKTYVINVRKKADLSAVPNAGTPAAVGASVVNTFVTFVTPISQTAP
jgi:hypothetical protein